MQTWLYRASVLVLCVLLSSPTFGQIFGKKAQPSGQAPEYSDADKKKMAELEQEPRVRAEIQAAWDEKRRKDLDAVYRLNVGDQRPNPEDEQVCQRFFTPAQAAEAEKAKNECERSKQDYFSDHLSTVATLYDNPMLQRYVNAIGQRLVPKDSPNIYSFKLLLYPVPFSHAYTTGTIVISTGMVSILDNEAQLAYILGREIAHVEKAHAYQIVHSQVLEDELNASKEATKALLKAFVPLVGGLIAMQIQENRTEWPEVFENEADDAAIGYMLDQSYDARESPRVFANLEAITSKDVRVSLGNAGSPAHLKARKIHLQELLAGDLKTQIEAKTKGTALTGSSGEFSLILAALKRDNGIIAFNYDLFAIARENLEEAVNLRSNDSRAQLYLGKVISVTARNEDDRLLAEKYFEAAIKYDTPRGAYPDPHLEHALHLIGENGDKNEINREVESYIALYQREHMGGLPTNMPILYDYLTLVGNPTWYSAPATVISTQNVEAVRINSSGGVTALNGPQVVQNATRSSSVSATSPSPEPAPDAAPAAKTKAKSSTKKGGI